MQIKRLYDKELCLHLLDLIEKEIKDIKQNILCKYNKEILKDIEKLDNMCLEISYKTERNLL